VLQGNFKILNYCTSKKENLEFESLEHNVFLEGEIQINSLIEIKSDVFFSDTT
jgi:hypothetical protein